jgi:hypothetical protein
VTLVEVPAKVAASGTAQQVVVDGENLGRVYKVGPRKWAARVKTTRGRGKLLGEFVGRNAAVQAVVNA